MITVLSETDIASLELSTEAIRGAVSAGLTAQSQGQAVAQPTTMFDPVPGREESIAVVQGALPKESLALVKTVGGFPRNAAQGLATNPGCLTIIETTTGQVVGLMPAATITTMRTAMVTAIGALTLARTHTQVLGCIGTRGIGIQAVRYIARFQQLAEIRLCGRDLKQTMHAAGALSEELKVPVLPTTTWNDCLDGADIFIDGAALQCDQARLPISAISPGTVIVVYGAYSSLPLAIMDHIEKLVMDRWVGDGRGGLGPQTKEGLVSEATVDAFVGDLIAKQTSPRQSDGDRILYCHRGVAACDLMLSSLLLKSAKEAGLGSTVEF